MTDKLKLLHENLKEIKGKFEDLQKSGIDREILEIYLQHKTHLTKKKVRDFLKNLDDFYQKLVSEEMLKNL